MRFWSGSGTEPDLIQLVDLEEDGTFWMELIDVFMRGFNH